MRHQMRRIFESSTAIAMLLFVAACGGRETVASKSAQAFREAQQKGTPATASSVDAGTSSADHSTMSGMDSNAGVAAPSAMTVMDHSKMNMSNPPTMAGMNHSTNPGMQGGTPSGSSMTGMDHSRMAGNSARTPTVDHSTMTDMDHSNMPGKKPAATPQGQPMAGMDHSSMPGMQHGATGDAKVVAAAPSTNTEIQHVQPASTLQPDAFDAPAAISVAEASRATQGGGTGTGGTSAPAVDHGQHGSAAPSSTPQAKSAATIYTCPMHPEVTSDKPGTCPKCGMALVKKKS